MDEQKKTFDTVSIVVLLILALMNDGMEVFFDILAMTGVGITGEAIMEPFNFIMDGVVTVWFAIKCGIGGAPTIMQYIDDLCEVAGIPGRTICVGAGILVANNPKLAAVTKVAEVAGIAALTGGTGAVAAEGATAAEAGAVTAEAGAAATAAEGTAISGEVTAEAGSAVRGGVRGVAEETDGEGRISEEAPSKEEEEREKERKIEEEMEPEEERSPTKVLQEKLLKEVPSSKKDEDENEEEGEGEETKRGDQRSNLIDFQKRAEEIRRRQTGLPPAPKIIDTNEEGDENIEEAA
jgi:hypothetical protein